MLDKFRLYKKKMCIIQECLPFLEMKLIINNLLKRLGKNLKHNFLFIIKNNIIIYIFHTYDFISIRQYVLFLN